LLKFSFVVVTFEVVFFTLSVCLSVFFSFFLQVIMRYNELMDSPAEKMKRSYRIMNDSNWKREWTKEDIEKYWFHFLHEYSFCRMTKSTDRQQTIMTDSKLHFKCMATVQQATERSLTILEMVHTNPLDNKRFYHFVC
jgi:hypothetical protein